MKGLKRSLLVIALAGGAIGGAAQAQISDNVVKIGVLSDMSSLYTDLAGAGSVVAARMAVEDSGIEKRGYKVNDLILTEATASKAHLLSDSGKDLVLTKILHDQGDFPEPGWS